jgi:hypothetical protein
VRLLRRRRLLLGLLLLQLLSQRSTHVQRLICQREPKGPRHTSGSAELVWLRILELEIFAVFEHLVHGRWILAAESWQQSRSMDLEVGGRVQMKMSK